MDHLDPNMDHIWTQSAPVRLMIDANDAHIYRPYTPLLSAVIVEAKFGVHKPLAYDNVAQT